MNKFPSNLDFTRLIDTVSTSYLIRSHQRSNSISCLSPFYQSASHLKSSELEDTQNNAKTLPQQHASSPYTLKIVVFFKSVTLPVEKDDLDLS